MHRPFESRSLFGCKLLWQWVPSIRGGSSALSKVDSLRKVAWQLEPCRLGRRVSGYLQGSLWGFEDHPGLFQGTRSLRRLRGLCRGVEQSGSSRGS